MAGISPSSLLFGVKSFRSDKCIAFYGPGSVLAGTGGDPWKNAGIESAGLAGRGTFSTYQTRGHGKRKLGGGRRWKYSPRASIGFTVDPGTSIERAANGLLKDAASLLVYADVLRSPLAQTFLRLLLQLRRADDAIKVLETYAEFFRLLVEGSHSSWKDYILDAILETEDNAFAKSASSSASSPPSVPDTLRLAAAVDLDALQRLAVTESTLCTWIEGRISHLNPEWQAAAAGLATSGWRSASGHDHPLAENGVEQNSRRHRWRKKIGGLSQWSEAVPILEQFHFHRGFGPCTLSTCLSWKEGRLLSEASWAWGEDYGIPLSLHASARSSVRATIARHLAGLPAPHILLYGPDGSGKSWLLFSELLHASRGGLEEEGIEEEEEGGKGQMRVVWLSRGDVKSLQDLLEAARKMPRLRFFVVVDDAQFRAGEELMLTLKGALEGFPQQWPKNALLCATSLRRDLVRGAPPSGQEDFSSMGPLGPHFGLALTPFGSKSFGNEDFLACVEDILRSKDASAEEVEKVKELAANWLTREGTPSLMLARRLVDSL